MMPTHHVHISTGFAFVVLLFVLAAVGGFLWYRVAMKRAAQPRPPEQKPTARYKPDRPAPPPPMRPASAYRAAPYSYTAPSASALSPAPSPSGFTAGAGFIGGLVVGNILSASEAHHSASSFDPGPSYDSGSSSSSSSDSGFSYDSGSSSGGSGDSGSSSGFDVSW